MKKPRHIPIRTCVACRTTDAKRGLLRVVRQPDQSVVYDPKGKLSGRGAYVCATPECIGLARKRRQLERSLKATGLTDALFDELTQAAALRPVPEPAPPPDGGDAETEGGQTDSRSEEHDHNMASAHRGGDAAHSGRPANGAGKRVTI